jgi:hypothetical protein
MFFLSHPSSDFAGLAEALNTIFPLEQSGTVIVLDNDSSAGSLEQYSLQIALMQKEAKLHSFVVVHHLNSTDSDFLNVNTNKMNGRYNVVSVRKVDLGNINKYLTENELCSKEMSQEIVALKHVLNKA